MQQSAGVLTTIDARAHRHPARCTPWGLTPQGAAHRSKDGDAPMTRTRKMVATDDHAPRLSVDGVCCDEHAATLCGCGNFGEHVANVDCTRGARVGAWTEPELRLAWGDR